MVKAQHRERKQSTRLHPENPHQGRYDFDRLCQLYADLRTYVSVNRFGSQTIDFHDPEAVKALNKALLMQSYGISFWDIPSGYLCPPIPGRADYIHHLSDLLASNNAGVVPRGRKIKGLDIGVGANCIYPIIGCRTYGWQFVGTDIDPVAVDTANLIAAANPSLKGQIECRLQADSGNIFRGIIHPADRFDFTLCNPPFHSSAQEAEAGSLRKLRNLGKSTETVKLNFGGQSNELWCDGGELVFLKRMVAQSRAFSKQCYLFSSLVSKHENIIQLKRTLKNAGARQVMVVNMSQGMKVSRLLAWTFLSDSEQLSWRELHWSDK